MRRVAMAFTVGEYIADELLARGWSIDDLAQKMGANTAIEKLALELLIAASNEGVRLGRHDGEKLAQVFNVSPDYFLNLEKAYFDWRAAVDGILERPA